MIILYFGDLRVRHVDVVDTAVASWLISTVLSWWLKHSPGWKGNNQHQPVTPLRDARPSCPAVQRYRLQTADCSSDCSAAVFSIHLSQYQPPVLARQGMEVLIWYGVDRQWSSSQISHSCVRDVLDTWFKQILTNIETDNQPAWDHLCQEHRVNFRNNNIQSLPVIHWTEQMQWHWLAPSELQ